MAARYLATLLLASGLLLGAHALLCWWVDPYAIWRPSPVAGPAGADPADLFHHLRLTKSYQLERFKPEVLILGSSRAASLPPATIAQGGQRAYNAALPGLTPYEMWSYFRHAAAIKTPAKLVLALDYESFLLGDAPFRLGFSASRLATSPQDAIGLGPLRRHYRDYWPTLLSLSSSRIALTHLVGSPDVSGTLVFADGTWKEKIIPGRIQLAGRPGYRAIIRQYFDQLSSQQPEYDLSYLGKIIDECHRLGIETVLYISPAHHAMATVYQRTQHLRSRQQWQRDIVALLAERAGRHRAAAFPLWGFEDGPVSAEQIPQAGQPQGWYRDGLHINEDFGRAILVALFSAGVPTQGTPLDGDSIDGYLRNVELSLAAYQLSHSGEIDWLTAITRPPQSRANAG